MEQYYQKEIECASQEQIKAWQDERLLKQVRHVWENVPYYKKKMEEKGVTPDDIKSADDLHKLPFVSKDDLREAYPYGLLAKPLSECVRIQSTSGTTGKRVVAFYTQHDIDLWEDCCAGGGRDQRRCLPGFLRLRTLYRRPGVKRRLAQGRLSHDSDFLRKHRAADHVH